MGRCLRASVMSVGVQLCASRVAVDEQRHAANQLLNGRARAAPAPHQHTSEPAAQACMMSLEVVICEGPQHVPWMAKFHTARCDGACFKLSHLQYPWRAACRPA